MSSRRKTKGNGFRVQVGTTLPSSIFSEIEALSAKHGLTNAHILRELVVRGLAAYHRDGNIHEDSNRQPVTMREDNESVGILPELSRGFVH